MLYLPVLQGYLRALGMKRTAEVKRDAKIGEAEAKKDSGIKVKSCFPLANDHRTLDMRTSLFHEQTCLYVRKQLSSVE